MEPNTNDGIDMTTMTVQEEEDNAWNRSNEIVAAPTTILDEGESIISGGDTVHAVRMAQEEEPTLVENETVTRIGGEQRETTPTRSITPVTATAEWSNRNLLNRRRLQATVADNSSAMTQDGSSTSNDSDDKSDDDKIWCGSRRCRLFFIAASVLLLLVAVITVASLTLLPNNKNRNTPTDLLFYSEAVPRVRTFILEHNWSDALALLDPVSPQTRAIHQLALEDQQQYEISKEHYALLVVWFGLGLDSSLANHYCDWQEMVQCNSQQQIVNLTLWNQGLHGSIVDEIGMLSKLGM